MITLFSKARSSYLIFSLFFIAGINCEAFSERLWYPANKMDFFDYIIKGPTVNLNLGDQNQILDFNHPVTRFMQDWATAIDQTLRATDPYYFKNIPQPKIAVPILPRQYSNTTTMPLCFTVKTKIQDKANLKTNNTLKIAVSYSGKVEIYDRPCKVLDVSKMANLVGWSNRIHSDCPIKVQKNQLDLSGCGEAVNSIPYNEVGGIVFQPMSPWILMDISKFLMGFEYAEEMFLSELTHELAHFYQAHLSNSASNSVIFYEIENRQWNQIPKLDRELQSKWSRLPIATKNIQIKLANDEKPNVDDLKLIGSALKEKIGSYTLEDEAFYLQSYYLSLIGINPAIGIQHLFEVWNYQKSRQVFYLPGEIPFAQCKLAYENAWKNSNQPLFIPPANFNDYHHSFCFLIYAVDRGGQSLANDYINHKRPSSKVSWDEVNKQVQSIFRQ